ncbi:hypothetical protein KAU13_03990 [candidate division WOR-3 bacterium]|nr:hypothetical protein [candidate division WOR-3 bacterium]TET79910.1 MAG: hypothetical protein E3J41_00620 [Candidatus Cloacimonadota bacterium]
MKKINTILLFILLSIFSFFHAGCKGGNPFNFIIGKMTKSVEKEQLTVQKDVKEKVGIVPGDLPEKPSEIQAAISEEDSLAILEIALGIERFRYRSGGRRDPFETLFKGKELNVENVKLVGTIWGPKGRFALLKEPGGSGFVVGIGDRIADGRVIDITSSSVTFQISKFGVTSKVTLMLEEKIGKLK